MPSPSANAVQRRADSRESLLQLDANAPLADLLGERPRTQSDPQPRAHAQRAIRRPDFKAVVAALRQRIDQDRTDGFIDGAYLVDVRYDS